MSAVKEAIAAIREALRLADEVRQVGEGLKAVALELRDHDRRITRLEAKWEAALELAGMRAAAIERLERKA
jgi:hypothetical protein